MADIPTGKGFLTLAWTNALPLLVGFIAGALVGRFFGALFGL